jgi:flagellar biogenesis protein FliO
MNADPGLLMPLLKISAALAIVLVLLLLALRGMRRWMGPGAGRDTTALIRVVATHPMGPKKSVSLVRVPGLLLVLGVSSDRIEPLARIDDPALLADVDKTAPAGVARFGEHLARLTRRPTTEQVTSGLK